MNLSRAQFKAVAKREFCEFLPDFGLDAGNRRDHDETTAPEP